MKGAGYGWWCLDCCCSSWIFLHLFCSPYLERRSGFLRLPSHRWCLGLSQVPFTICVAYAVLKQRLFQVSFIVRQSLQYAVARGALLIPIPILAGILIFDLIAHKDQPFAVLLSAHGWAYAFMGVVGIVAHKKQSQWMEVLDRRFYREHYNAQHLLRQTVDEIRASSNLADVAPKAVARIEQALHPEFVSILMREATEPALSLHRFGAAGSLSARAERREQAHGGFSPFCQALADIAGRKRMAQAAASLRRYELSAGCAH